MNINQIISEKYHVDLKNIKSVEEADIICIGEHHTSDEHRKNQASIIDHFYKESRDRILIEAPSNYYRLRPIPNTQIEYCKQVKNAYGWDLPYSYSANELNLPLEYKKIYHSINAVVLLCMVCIVVLQTAQPLEDRPWLKSATQIIAFTGTVTACIHLFQKARNIDLQILGGLKSRNESMCANIEHHLQFTKKRKLIVLAGFSHFPEGVLMAAPLMSGNDEKITKKATECIQDCFKDKKVAVLIPKKLGFTGFFLKNRF